MEVLAGCRERFGSPEIDLGCSSVFSSVDNLVCEALFYL